MGNNIYLDILFAVLVPPVLLVLTILIFSRNIKEGLDKKINIDPLKYKNQDDNSKER
jgi:hypothetical protein